MRRLGLATERIEMQRMSYVSTHEGCLGLATERIEIFDGVFSGTDICVSVLRPSGLKFAWLRKIFMSSWSRSCDRAD